MENVNIKYNNKIIQISPYDMTLNDALKPGFQKIFTEQHGYDNYLKFCYYVIVGDPYELDEKQYEYYLHEIYDDYPII